MYSKIINIIIFWLIAFVLAVILYPFYIKLIKYLKFNKNIRESDVSWKKSEIFSKLHWHKSWTPTMWWALFFVIMSIMIIISLISEHIWYTNFSLLNAKEVWLPLLWFFGMWIIWIIDDIFNILWIWKVKWLSSITKTIWMMVFAIFISCRFYFALGIDYIILRPFFGEFYVWIFFIPIFMWFIYMVTNAINITDWMDGSVWWMMIIILISIWIMIFLDSKYLSSAIIAVLVACITAFLRYNINPAKIFMWDSGSLWLWWFLSVLIMLLNIEIWIIIPFIILFGIFIVTFFSSVLQIFWKYLFDKKLFLVAPLHHYFELKWINEHTIVMKYWLIQWILSAIFFIIMFFQLWL